MRIEHLLVAAGSVGASLALSGLAFGSDGAYGRFEGDAMAAIEVGGSYAVAPPSARGPGRVARTGLFYVQTVGLTFQYEDRLGSAEAVERGVVGAVEVRPLFIGRFTQNLERGPAFLDLFVDSFGLGFGPWVNWERPPACPEACLRHGVELSLGFELPFLPQASTPYLALRGGLRWALSELEASSAPPLTGALTLTLGYHHVLDVRLVDAGDALLE